jgi:hypothetical protein
MEMLRRPGPSESSVVSCRKGVLTDMHPSSALGAGVLTDMRGFEAEDRHAGAGVRGIHTIIRRLDYPRHHGREVCGQAGRVRRRILADDVRVIIQHTSRGRGSLALAPSVGPGCRR